MARLRPMPIVALVTAVAACAAAARAAGPAPGGGPAAGVVARYCLSCHDADVTKGNLNLAALAGEDVGRHPVEWERVVRRLRARQMPPPGKARPGEDEYDAVVGRLEGELDRAAGARPAPGRTDTLRRLTRTEYQNAVRDLLALDVDAGALLPPDESGHGFDNVTVGTLSPTLLDRYVTAAQRVSRLAVGGVARRSGNGAPGGETFRVRPDVTQEEWVDGLPVGTRGGALIRYTFPRDGEYEVRVRLARDRNEHVEGLHGSHEVQVLLDRAVASSFTVGPPAAGKGHEQVDAHLVVRVSVTAGPHDLGVTFVKEPSSLVETARQPYAARFNVHRHPRLTPAVFQVSITGPFADRGPGDTPSRRRVLGDRLPRTVADEEPCARAALAAVMRRAYRRPVTGADVDRVMPFFREGREGGGGYDAGIESALSAVLVSREFLFRVERDPAGLKPDTAYTLSDLELASRLSFFLWASIPDDELLAAAERGELHAPDQLAGQARRMLADPRARRALVGGFAAQWLHLRNLDAITPDGRLFPDFDDNLRQAFRRETELLVDEVVREDRSVLDLLRADHVYLNERLAKHYGVAHVYGPAFRRVDPGPDAERGGLLRQGSILTVTSYATRTSPVLRGKWVLDNLLGQSPPPPPPDVPALDDNTVSVGLPVRDRLTQHRANPACATCHDTLDPVGFALERYDAVGRLRWADEGRPVDSTGGLPDGSRFAGAAGLEAALLRRPDLFAGTLTEKLMTYALGRGVGPSDGPAVRAVVRAARAGDYRFSAFVVGIVQGTPFRMRSTPP